MGAILVWLTSRSPDIPFANHAAGGRCATPAGCRWRIAASSRRGGSGPGTAAGAVRATCRVPVHARKVRTPRPPSRMLATGVSGCGLSTGVLLLRSFQERSGTPRSEAGKCRLIPDHCENVRAPYENHIPSTPLQGHGKYPGIRDVHACRRISFCQCGFSSRSNAQQPFLLHWRYHQHQSRRSNASR